MEPNDWVKLLSSDVGIRMQPAASTSHLEACESAVGTTLPSSLRNLYLATDGIFDESGQWFLVWQLADVAKRNLLAWDVEGSERSDWVGFGDDGTGNPFCVRRSGGEDVYYWNPIDQEATYLAADAAAFWIAMTSNSLPHH